MIITVVPGDKHDHARSSHTTTVCTLCMHTATTAGWYRVMENSIVVFLFQISVPLGFGINMRALLSDLYQCYAASTTISDIGFPLVTSARSFKPLDLVPGEEA